MLKYNLSRIQADPEAWERLYDIWIKAFGEATNLLNAAVVEAGDSWQLNSFEVVTLQSFLQSEGADFGIYTPEGLKADANTAPPNAHKGNLARVILNILDKRHPMTTEEITAQVMARRHEFPHSGKHGAKAGYPGVVSALRGQVITGTIIGEGKGMGPNCIRRRYRPAVPSDPHLVAAHISDIRKHLAALKGAGLHMYAYGKYADKIRFLKGSEEVAQIEIDKNPSRI